MGKKTKLKRKELFFRARRLSVLRIFFFAVFFFLVIVIVFFIAPQRAEFPDEPAQISLDEKIVRGEYYKLYSLYEREIEKLELWLAYKAAKKLMQPADYLKNRSIEEAEQFIKEAVPRLYDKYVNEKISLNKLIGEIEKKYFALNPVRSVAKKELASASPPATRFDKTTPDWAFKAGFEACITQDTRKFNRYIRLLYRRILDDKKIPENDKKQYLTLLKKYRYALKQLLARTTLRKIGRKVLGLPTRFSAGEKARKLSFEEKKRALLQLFYFVANTVTVIERSKTYIPTFPLDTLFRGFGDLPTVNYVFSDLVSATLGEDCYELSLVVSGQFLRNPLNDYLLQPSEITGRERNTAPDILSIDKTKLICPFLYEPAERRYHIFAFDFRTGVPLLDEAGDLLDLAQFLTEQAHPLNLLKQLLPYLRAPDYIRNCEIRYYVNPLQLTRYKLAKYLYKLGINIDPRNLQLGDNMANEFVKVAGWQAQKLDCALGFPFIWRSLKPAELPFALLELTDDKAKKQYVANITADEAVATNLSAREIAFCFGWLDDAVDKFSEYEGEYFGYYKFIDYLKKTGIPIVPSNSLFSLLSPFRAAPVINTMNMINRKRQLEISALQAIYQLGIIAMLKDNLQQAIINFSDFLESANKEKLVLLKNTAFPGCFVSRAKLLLAECLIATGDNSGAARYLAEISETEPIYPAAKLLATHPELSKFFVRTTEKSAE